MGCVDLEKEKRYRRIIIEEPPRKQKVLTEEDIEEQEYADLPPVLTGSADHVERIRVWRGVQEQAYTKEQISMELVTELVSGILQGKWTRLAVSFQFQDEGVYVKKLKKKVYKLFETTLVIHHVDRRMACVYFDGNSKHCHLLLGDLYTYRNVDSSDIAQICLGNVILPQYAFHDDAEAVEKAIRFLFQHLEEADRTLCDSRLWATENYHGYTAKYEELQKRWGFGIETEAGK